ncbi:MAG: hypothetical protein LBQ02_01675 [Candidatus Nomurabacteria bacterium]|jgi:hypothetical protein|nr:hypothetical protein [Candidatus Nomurabacteria bacterium]
MIFAGFVGVIPLPVLLHNHPRSQVLKPLPSNRYWWQSVPRFNLSSQIEEPCEVGVGANKTLMESDEENKAQATGYFATRHQNGGVLHRLSLG